MGTDTKISVIIPTLNRAELLKQTLESIARQTLSEELFEIIVIDNGSSDHTKNVCMMYQRKHNNLIYIYDDRPGLHIGRNRGYLESKADILVYADDDIIALPTWLEAICLGFEDEETVLIGGNNYPWFEVRPPKWVKDLWIYDRKEKLKRLGIYSAIIIGDKVRRIDAGAIFGCNFAIRKRVLCEIRGFHPDGMPDNLLRYRGDGESYVTTYIKKKRWKAMFYPAASVKHVVTKERLTFNYVKKVSYRSGISYGYEKMRSIESKEEYIKVLKNVALNCLKSRYKLERQNINDIKNFYINKGMLYLTLQFGLNNKVRQWIKRDNYIDATIPEYYEKRKAI